MTTYTLTEEQLVELAKSVAKRLETKMHYEGSHIKVQSVTDTVRDQFVSGVKKVAVKKCLPDINPQENKHVQHDSLQRLEFLLP